MDLTIVNISDGALLRISDLIRNSEKLAYLVNELDSISYKDFMMPLRLIRKTETKFLLTLHALC